MNLEEQLSQRLQEDATWRIRELSELVRVCADGGSIRRNAVSRAALTILYAHWEGYFVVAANVYLNFLAQKRIAISSLGSGLVDQSQKITVAASDMAERKAIGDLS